MPTYIGFNSLDACKELPNLSNTVTGGLDVSTAARKIGKKFRMIDEKLVVRDFINALSIKQGEKVGRPSYGTTIWDFLFDPNTVELRAQIETEIRRIASQDPRIELGNLEIYSRESGVLIEVEVIIKPFNNIVNIGILLDNKTGAVSQLL